MSDTPPPPARRLRVADHVMARRHVVDGEEVIVLHDAQTGGLVRLGPREWGLLSCADGSRDALGVALAAARRGAHAREPAVAAFLAELERAGLVEDDAPDASTGHEPPAPVPADAPIHVLPDFGLHCDGGGSCCRLYASVLFAPEEAARARATLPLVAGGGARPELAFSPERGLDGPALAVTMIDGRCAYLEPAGPGGRARCALHAAAGAGAKPVGCRLFPATFAYDGEAVRVSVAVECACVLASAGRPGGEPLVAPGTATRRDLGEHADLFVVPERVAVTARQAVPRARFAAWSEALLARAPPADPLAAFWTRGAEIRERGLDAGPGERAAPPSASELAPWLSALAARAARRARDDAAWRSERDLARRATRGIAAAAEALLDGGAAELVERGPAAPASEALYWRAILHGHALARELPLSGALADRAVRLLVARALPAVIGAAAGGDPALGHPLALVEAMLRGHGLEAYAHDVPEP